MNNEKEVLTRSRIIFGALGAGQLMFLVISLVFAKEGLVPVEKTDPGTWIFPGIALLVAIAVFFVYRQQLSAGRKLSSREARLKMFPSVQIIRFVGIETGMLLLIVAFYLTHQFVLVYLAVLWLFVYCCLFPTKSQFEQFLSGERGV